MKNFVFVEGVKKGGAFIENPYLQGLRNRLVHFPAGLALTECSSGRSLTVEELWQGSDGVANILRHKGLQAGDRIVVTMKPDGRYCKIIFGLFRVGLIPAFLDATMQPSALDRCINELMPKLWVTDQKTDNFFQTDADELLAAAELSEANQFLEPLSAFEDSACLIIYTSGTTGLPKGTVWTYANVSSHLSAQQANFAHLGINTEFILFPHLAIAAIAMGRCSVLPMLNSYQPGLIDIKAVVEQMLEHGCDYIFGSPTFWRRMSEYCSVNRVRIDGVKAATTAGASFNCEILNRLSVWLPRAVISIPYASTEVLMPISSIALPDLSRLAEVGTRTGRGVPIGFASPDMVVKTVPMVSGATQLRFGAALENYAGAIGELVVAGPRVSTEYFCREALTLASKIIDSDGTLWHRMGDVGYVDEEGMIWLLGRLKQVRVSQGAYVFPDQQEQFYNARLQIQECALIVYPASEILFLIIPDQFSRLSMEEMARNFALQAKFQLPLVVYYPKRLPVDLRHNSKIDKAILEAWLITTCGHLVGAAGHE